MVAEKPGRPGTALAQCFEVVDGVTDRGRVPGLVQEGEVVGQMQLVAGVDVFDDSPEVVDIDLPDQHPVVVLIDHGADPAQAVMDRGPVLVVPHLGFPRWGSWLSRSSGSLAIL